MSGATPAHGPLQAALGGLISGYVPLAVVELVAVAVGPEAGAATAVGGAVTEPDSGGDQELGDRDLR
ncbi:hypothetical protein [Streptomyces sp. NPDC093600]|uniref:hypothetical protein n=1 Tax=Streptomyces sp. NPDC093600 TaxID=3366047 RepID=UPI00380538A3